MGARTYYIEPVVGWQVRLHCYYDDHHHYNHNHAHHYHHNDYAHPTISTTQLTLSFWLYSHKDDYNHYNDNKDDHNGPNDYNHDYYFQHGRHRLTLLSSPPAMPSLSTKRLKRFKPCHCSYNHHHHHHVINIFLSCDSSPWSPMVIISSEFVI